MRTEKQMNATTKQFLDDLTELNCHSERDVIEAMFNKTPECARQAFQKWMFIRTHPNGI